MIKQSDEVYVAKDANTTVSRGTVELLKNHARNTTRGRARLCLHQSSQEAVHEMVIVHPHGAYIPPHKHETKSETILILEGKCDYFIFSETGEIERKIALCTASEGGEFLFRLTEPLYHSLLIQSEELIFLEITKGPFNREETKFAPWAPDAGSTEEVEKFHALLATWGA